MPEEHTPNPAPRPSSVSPSTSGGRRPVAATALLVGACLLILSGVAVVLVQRTTATDQTSAANPASATGPAPDPGRTEIAVDVERCTEDSAYPVRPEEIPTTTRLPDQSFLPSGAMVAGIWGEREPIFVIGPAGAPCMVWGGATGLRAADMATDEGAIKVTLSAGGAMPTTLHGCEYVLGARSFVTRSYRELQAECFDPSAHPVEQLQTNTAGYFSALVKFPEDDSSAHGARETVGLFVYTLGPDGTYGAGQSVTCSLPDAGLCSASLGYFLEETGRTAEVPTDDRERLIQQIAAFVGRHLG